jgi:hypothetical protein
MGNPLDTWRGMVRPFLAMLVGTAVVGISVFLAVKFADAELARYIVGSVLAVWATISGFYFGERATKKKDEK